AALRAVAGELRPELPWLPGRSSRTLPDWVRPDARARLGRIVRGHPYRRMFRWAATLENRTNAPWARRGHGTLVHSGGDAGVELVQPLTEPSVVGSMLVAGGRWGFADRATAAAALFGESLPAEIRRRSDKVDFTHAYIAGPSRAFIDAWDGGGVPTELVDPDVLGAAWRSASPPYSSLPLLQHAWLELHGHERA
ncbi:MAG: asparagine synthase, partial [Ilumatobacteraceae bacterium]|nr:asparagine synthase [Ilumatobacteraceae bacterium]